MNIFYHPQYNIDLGLLNYLHPFDGKKFLKVYKAINSLSDIVIKQPESPVKQEDIDAFSGDLLRRLLSSKRYILRALEVPYIALLPFSVIDNRVLKPMRWGVAGTIAASKDALTGVNCWNLSGGFHHASPSTAEGFCIFNDIGITYNSLTRNKAFSVKDKILIIDIDAHHGNGNANTFMNNENVHILDIYNNDIYPSGVASKERVNIKIPLKSSVGGEEYLEKLKAGLNRLENDYKLAYVIAGTDVIETDSLGGMKLTINDCVTRDKMVLDRLRSLGIPAVFLGGGGYSSDSAIAITSSIKNLYQW